MLPGSQMPVPFFRSNRFRLMNRIEGPALLVLASGHAPAKGPDEHYIFHVNRNFYYLGGIDQEDVVLVCFRQGNQFEQRLFIPETDPMFERWRGHRATRDEAATCTGLDKADIYKSSDLHAYLESRLAHKDITLWIDSSATDSQAKKLRRHLSEKHARHLDKAQDADSLLTELRMIKQPDEIDRIEKSIHLTGEGIKAMIQRLKPGLMEYHLWSIFAHVLADAGCLVPAFDSIVAAGDNIFCLHYMHPFSEIMPGDLVQVDVGARVGGYCADISRVFPADGHFTQEQRKVYQVVRACQKMAFSLIRPGITLDEINEACRKRAKRGLVDMGIMGEDQPVTDYFWHNVSHHMGLDVHDPSDRSAVLAPGMVLTVEPGLYIPPMHIGMRIEDDVCVTETGCRVLSAGLLREAEEIEALMARRDS
jgi:Xaa-Pro aminopeptidase